MAIVLNFEIEDKHINTIREWVDSLSGSPQTAAKTKEFLKTFFTQELKKNIKDWKKSERLKEIETASELDADFGLKLNE